jgi:hypothetical protein
MLSYLREYPFNQTGFQRQGKISLKKYYESTQEYSLFQWIQY